MNSVCLFIDGTNLFAGQYELLGPYRYLNFSLFIKEIEAKLKVIFSKIFFYASYTPRPSKMSKKENLFLKNEYLFYKQVKVNPKVIFFKGYRSKTSGKEKEVDVKLSVDIVGYGLLEKYNNLYLMTGDADFLQALLFLKVHKPNIGQNLICFENKIMYKGLYYFPSHVVCFNKLKETVATRSKLVYLKKTADLCPRLG